MRSSAGRRILAALKERVPHGRAQGGVLVGEVAVQAGTLLGVILLSAALPRPSYASQLSAEEILNQVSATYQNLRTCRFVAEENVEVAEAGEARSPSGTAWSNFQKSTQTQIDVAAVMPAKLRLVVKDEKLDIVLVSDGQTTWTYLPKQKQYSEVLGALSEATDTFRLIQYWNLLVGRFRGAAKFASTAKLEKDSRIKVGRDKVDCYVVMVQASDVMREMWVDKNRFVIVRFKQTPLRPQEGIALQTTTTVNLTEADVNTDLDDNLFKFTPPENAIKVPSLNRTGK